MAFYFSTFVALKKVQVNFLYLYIALSWEKILTIILIWFKSFLDTNLGLNYLPKILFDIFRDEDGDLITLRNSLDLEVALSYSRVLKLTLFIHGKISAEDKYTKNIINKNLVKELKSIRNRITEILDSILDEVNETNSDEHIVKDIG